MYQPNRIAVTLAVVWSVLGANTNDARSESDVFEKGTKLTVLCDKMKGSNQIIHEGSREKRPILMLSSNFPKCQQATQCELIKLIEKSPYLMKQCEILLASEEMYFMQFGEVAGFGQGTFGFDGIKFIITIERDGNAGEFLGQSASTKLSHEFEHALQFERGEIGFYLRTESKNWLPFSYDVFDEVGSWKASLKAAPNSDFWAGNGRSQLGQFYSLNGDKNRATFLIAGPHRSDGFDILDNYWNDPYSFAHGVSLTYYLNQLKAGSVTRLKFKLKNENDH